MAITRVQGGVTLASSTRAFASDVTAGNLLTARITWQGAAGITLNSVTDSQGNTWTIHSSAYNTVLTQYLQIASCTAGSSGPCTITVSLSSGTAKAISADEWNNSAGPMEFDVGAGNTGFSPTLNSSDVVTTTDNQLGISQCVANASIGASFTTPTGGFTEDRMYTGHWWNNDLSNLDLGTAGTKSAGETLVSGLDKQWGCTIATFKLSGGGGSEHDLTPDNSSQANANSTAGITQAHVLTGATASQGNTSSTTAITQSHALTGANASQSNTASSPEISQASSWYVRPDTSHNTTRDGTSYATAWGGWSEITWGGSGVSAGDSLYVCGSHAYASGISVGNHGATEEAERVTIASYAGDPGSITFSGSAILTVGRSYTSISGLTITAGTGNCIFTFGVIAGLTISGCTFNGGTSAPIINISGGNGYSQTDLTIDSNTFADGGGSNGSAISWLVGASGSPVNNLNRVTISNNNFTDCSSARAVICLRIEDSGSENSNMADIVATGNVLSSCSASAMEIYGPGVYGRNTGIRVTDNVINNQQMVGSIGGGMSIGGFGPSLTDGFGDNEIARNEAYVIDGPNGHINLFYGTYQVFGNYGEDLSTGTIDGNGILFDHGCDDCVAYDNEYVRITGKSGVLNSGCGIMVLDATNCEAYNNTFDECRIGIYLGDKGAGQSSNIYDNEFLNCSEKGIYVHSGADMAENLATLNLFTASNYAAIPVHVASGTYTGESQNTFHDFAAASGHTLDASDTVVRNLVAESASQGNASSEEAITQGHALTAQGSVQANTAEAVEISQTGAYIASNCTQANSATGVSITQAHVLVAANSTQGNAASSGSLSQRVDLTVAAPTQANTGSTGSITQAHTLIHAPSVQDNVAEASEIVQAHILAASNATQANAASTGAITGAIVYSSARTYTVRPENRIYEVPI